jgi:hypothetical protein
MSEFYHQKAYNINSRIKELIEKQRGYKELMSNVEAENIVSNSLEGKFKKDVQYVTEEKSLLTRTIYIINPNKYKEEELKNLSEFIKIAFDQEEIIGIVKHITQTYYKPGVVINLMKAYNENVIYFVSQFSDILKINHGIIINSKFVGDMLKVFPDLKYDENDGTITDSETLVTELKNIIKNFKLDLSDLQVTVKSDGTIKVYDDNDEIVKTETNDIFVLSSENEETIKFINNVYKDSFKIELIPMFYFE